MAASDGTGILSDAHQLEPATKHTIEPMEDILIPIVAIVVPVLSAFGIVYIIYSARHRERMSMIDKGLTPETLRSDPEPHKTLRNGLLWMGIGIGLMLGWLFNEHVMNPTDEGGSVLPPLVGAAIFGGLSQVLYYLKFRNMRSE